MNHRALFLWISSTFSTKNAKKLELQCSQFPKDPPFMNSTTIYFNSMEKEDGLMKKLSMIKILNTITRRFKDIFTGC